MTMALTVVMIVLIGVMGAGILVFVQRDLESVIDVNKGQKAFELADAGIQTAKQQLLSDAFRRHYDTTHTNDCANQNFRETPEDWSPAPNGYPNNMDCTGVAVAKSGGSGVSRDFAGGKFTVTIQCLDQFGDSTTPDPCVTGGGPADSAPEPSVPASSKTFFKVTSTGQYPADGSGAKRKIEAIFNTKDLGIPKGYYSPTKVDIGGGACLSYVSVFSLQDIDVGGGSGCPGPGSDHLQGADISYGNWQNAFNSTPRVSSNAGYGAVLDIDDEVSGRDYDGNDVPDPAYPRFIQNIPASGQTSAQMTFPFDYKTVENTADVERLDFYEEEAKRQEAAEPGFQGHYQEISGTNPPLTVWPSNSSYKTVVYVKLTDANPGKLTWDIGVPSDPDLGSPYPSGCNAPIRKGILVVENGNFTTQPNRALFSGSLIVRGGTVENGDYTDTGSTCLEGYVNANGEIIVNGSASPTNSPDLSMSPGYPDLF